MRFSEHTAERPWWLPKWYELLPEVVLVAGLTLFLVDEADAATSAFKSTRALGIMAAGAAGWVIARVALARLLPWRTARTTLFAVAAAGALAVVVLPAYDDDTVVETFPVAPAADVLTTTTVPTTTASPTEPIRLRSAPFMGIDHRASGTVSVYRSPDGRHVVGLEMFDIQPGPDYDVYVVPGSDRDDRDGGVRLDDLRGNRGTQYYEVPVDVDVGQGKWTVLVWCQTFGVPVANATPI